ncbi:hypothetical protein D3C71_1918280 [compost metagenome]
MRDEGLPGQPVFHVTALIEALNGNRPTRQVQQLRGRLSIADADDPGGGEFQGAAVAQHEGQLLGVDGLIVQTQARGGRVQDQQQRLQLFCRQGSASECHLSAGLEMTAV